eukprot:TRINITY_DN17437_c0_g1_i1.p1 TRINITY_DN17437_c0_g1~~TRINITY_DN17437_c0_g1_i1.p1  ORF type:complete len:222 (+),score=20.72 TRINITY_DN17437_c0_g1_i1:29-694(+)
MSQRKVKFFFDYLSPYAYLALHKMIPISQRNNVQLELVPTLFAALLNHHKNIGPAEIPVKKNYVFKSCGRTAAEMGIGIKPPPHHPFPPVLPLRVTCAARDPESRLALTKNIFDAVWCTGEGIEDQQVLARCITQAGLDPEKILQAAASNDIKAELRANTDMACNEGVWGVPTMIVHPQKELFWGLDSVGHVDTFLQGKDPLNLVDAAAWENIVPSAERKR